MSDREPITIPPAFFQTLTFDESSALCDNNGWLNAEQRARLWRMTDRQGDPPTSLQLRMSVADLMLEFPPVTRQQRRAAKRRGWLR
jgi:hypothetical protein